MSKSQTVISLDDHKELRALKKCSLLKRLPYVQAEGAFILLRDGPTSYVIRPKEQLHIVIKVLKETRHPNTMSCADEHALINKLKATENELMKLPDVYASGKEHNFLVMSHIGDHFYANNENVSCYKENAPQIGKVMGDFAASLYKDFGLVYKDLHPGNMTLDNDGRIGIIDIAAINKGKAEEMLFLPVLYNAPMAISMARTFFRRTGNKLNQRLISIHAENLAFELNGITPRDPDIATCYKSLNHFNKEASRYPDTFFSEHPNTISL